MWMRLDFTRSYKFLAFLVVLGDLLNFSYSCGGNSYHRRRNRDKTPLQLKQRVPNVAEFSNAASGAPLGKIKHPRGKNSSLVPCYNTNVVFKDDEGTGADRLMSRVSFFSFCLHSFLVFYGLLSPSMELLVMRQYTTDLGEVMRARID